jgi:hypothetical protein
VGGGRTCLPARAGSERSAFRAPLHPEVEYGPERRLERLCDRDRLQCLPLGVGPTAIGRCCRFVPGRRVYTLQPQIDLVCLAVPRRARASQLESVCLIGGSVLVSLRY